MRARVPLPPPLAPTAACAACGCCCPSAAAAVVSYCQSLIEWSEKLEKQKHGRTLFKTESIRLAFCIGYYGT